MQSEFSHAALPQLAEQTERAAWLDHWDATPADWKEQFGVETYRVGGAAVLLFRAVPIMQFNRAFCLGVDEEVSPKQLDEIIEIYQRRDINQFAIQIPTEQNTAAIQELLTARGFQVGSHWLRTAIDTSKLQAQSVPGVEIAEATKDQAQDYARLIQEGFETPPFFRAPSIALVGRPNWQIFIASINGEPVAASTNFLCGDVAWGGIAATVPAVRGKGIQTALLATQTEAACKAGCKYIVGEVEIPPEGGKNSSMNNMLRLGVETPYQRANWTRR